VAQNNLFRKLDSKKIECLACTHNCKIPSNFTGLCGVRQNINGKIKLLVYGRVVAENVDPIEKKPLFHFLPGSKSYSLGTLGCNFFCKNCQNFDISQIFGFKGKILNYKEIFWGKKLSPVEAVKKAITYGCESISYTYNEPTIWVEYALEIMKLAKENNLKNVWVSNGFMSKQTFELISNYLDAINIDIKSFRDSFYRKNCGAKLKPVLDTCKRVVKRGIHLEITTLVIPTLSDDEKMLKDLAVFIKQKLGDETPWHISAFSSSISWKLQHLPDTSFEVLKRVYEIGKGVGLKYVYLGNVLSKEFESTYCPRCGKTVIEREGYFVKNFVKKGKCPFCGYKIKGIYE